MALWINRDGTRTLEAPASQYWYLVGAGWFLADPSSLPVVPAPSKTIGALSISGSLLTAVYSDGTIQILTLPAGGTAVAGGLAGIAIDTDGAPYLADATAAGVALDIDEVPYISSYVGAGTGGNSSSGGSGVAIDTDGVAYVTPGGPRTVALDTDGVAYVAA